MLIKRLLGLAYFWGGAQNTVELQLWATWLLYAGLIDLTDRVVEALVPPLEAISIKRVFRSLYYAAQACQQDPIPMSSPAWPPGQAALPSCARRCHYRR